MHGLGIGYPESSHRKHKTQNKTTLNINENFSIGSELLGSILY